ncbi:MAG: hypothetical protein IPN67_17845 [Bacteroidales bacterium]|nr:hypothetical protein [Bacteroidales bacterium]MBK8884154.1 hypothetical protein [Bacteroidales bacterium]
MKILNLFKSNADVCRRRIVVAEINILRNLDENQPRQDKIVREMGKLHSLWFKGISRDLRM